jgi:hypothetical protein
VADPPLAVPQRATGRRGRLLFLLITIARSTSDDSGNNKKPSSQEVVEERNHQTEEDRQAEAEARKARVKRAAIPA